ncbi:MAG: nucleotidyltransferase domain-containing protein [Prevotella sp.]|nr:nucleotidyltransferase domain-containing protein [Prevotella sp.]
MDKAKALRHDEALEFVRQYKDVIAPRFDERTEVIMFGSYSKSYANADSDIDVAVIVPKIEEGKWFEWAKSLWHGVRKVSFLIEPVLLEQNESSPLYRDVMLTGIAV